MARNVWYRLHAPRVDLIHPDSEIDVFATPNGLWWGRLWNILDQGAFDARPPRGRRPWSRTSTSPTSLRTPKCLETNGWGSPSSAR